jgi:hypothetical protein
MSDIQQKPRWKCKPGTSAARLTVDYQHVTTRHLEVFGLAGVMPAPAFGDGGAAAYLLCESSELLRDATPAFSLKFPLHNVIEFVSFWLLPRLNSDTRQYRARSDLNCHKQNDKNENFENTRFREARIHDFGLRR